MEKRYKTRAELKQEVKDLFRGNWGTAIQLNLVPFLIQLALVGVIVLFVGALIALFIFSGADSNSVSSGGNYASNYAANYSGGSGVTSPISWVFDILIALIGLGISFTLLDWYRTKEKPKAPFQAAFSVFTKKYFMGAVVTMILKNIFVSLWYLLLVVPGIVKSYSYAQTYFIFKDLTDDETGNYDVKYLDCITQSRRLMDGHKFELFVLDLSFIGWDILGMLSLGIGYLWIAPYKAATKAAFYQNLVENQ